jgi:hypothetical protein
LPGLRPPNPRTVPVQLPHQLHYSKHMEEAALALSQSITAFTKMAGIGPSGHSP